MALTETKAVDRIEIVGGWAHTNQTNFSGGEKYVSFSYFTNI